MASGEPQGVEGVVAGAIDEARGVFSGAVAAAEGEQLDLLDPPTPAEVVAARRARGDRDGDDAMAALDLAQAKRRGRPPGARNKRTDDFARYLLSKGQHPAIVLMEIATSAPEVLIEASRQPKVHSFQKDGTPNVVIERMSYEAAQQLRKQCAAELLPYVEGKMPVKVDMNVRGDLGLLVIEGLTHTAEETADIVAGEFLEVSAQVPLDEAETAENRHSEGGE